MRTRCLTAGGAQLLGLCKNTGLRICNGRVAGDQRGSITSRGTSGGGQAVVDYVLACPRLFPLVQRLSVSQGPFAGLDHCALRIDISLQAPLEEGEPAAAAAPPPPPDSSWSALPVHAIALTTNHVTVCAPPP